MNSADVVDVMVGRVRRERTQAEPLHVTARRVWQSTSVDDASRQAMEAVGEQAIADAGGWPEGYPPSEGDNLAYVGFLTMVGERLIADDA